MPVDVEKPVCDIYFNFRGFIDMNIGYRIRTMLVGEYGCFEQWQHPAAVLVVSST